MDGSLVKILAIGMMMAAMVTVAGCTKTGKTKSFFALGDSYTIGEAVPEAGRWPVQLVAMLRSEGLDVADPFIVAKTGWTTDELTAAIQDLPISEHESDLVTLLIGVNNQYRGRSSDEYREQFRELLNRAAAFARGNASHVIVLSIPDWGVTPFAEGRDRAQIAREIDLFNRIAYEETATAGAHYVDIAPVSREFKSELAGDGLHPSGAMYRRWAELALPVARSVLRDGK